MFIVRMADGPLAGKFYTVDSLHDITGCDSMEPPTDDSPGDVYVPGEEVLIPEDGKLIFPDAETCHEYHFRAA